MALTEENKQMKSTLPSYDELADMLLSEGVVSLSPSELHGVIAGQLAGGARHSEAQWFQILAVVLDAEQFVHASSKTMLLRLPEVTLDAFKIQGDESEVLLPSSEYPLSQRVDALCAWCSGFLAGFGLHMRDTLLSEDAQEALHDIAAIAQASSNPEDLSDENEVDLLELHGYLKVAVGFLFEQCQPSKSSSAPSPSKTLH